MTDNEYAEKIYCQVFRSDFDYGDAYVCGILKALATLSPQEQACLESCFRHGYSFKETGVFLGNISGESVRQIVGKALLKLRHPSKKSMMSVSAIVAHHKARINDAAAQIEKLLIAIENINNGMPIDPSVDFLLESRKQAVSQLGLSSRICNHLIKEGISTVESLLKLDSLESLTSRRNFGQKSFAELLTKMREHGHNEWADRMGTQ
ncbi:MAG: hypothetical protein FWB75_03195 [Oscillospiraceae bacterium]|nr:hypothetical protein [Oscillospiraceae bacterium]